MINFYAPRMKEDLSTTEVFALLDEAWDAGAPDPGALGRNGAGLRVPFPSLRRRSGVVRMNGLPPGPPGAEERIGFEDASPCRAGVPT